MTREQSKLSPKKIGPKPRKPSRSTQEKRQQDKMAQPAKQANNLAKMGRYGDTELVHMHPAEIEGIARLTGRRPTINPVTGKPEMFFFLPFLAPALAGAAAPAIAAATAPAIAAATATPAIAATTAGLGAGMTGAAAGAAGALGTGLASLPAAAAPMTTAGLTGAAGAAAPAAATAAGEAAAMGAGASGLTGSLGAGAGAGTSITAAAPEALGGAMASAPEALGSAATAAPSSLASGSAALPQSSQFLTSGGLEIGSSNAATTAGAPMSAANNIGTITSPTVEAANTMNSASMGSNMFGAQPGTLSGSTPPSGIVEYGMNPAPTNSVGTFTQAQPGVATPYTNTAYPTDATGMGFNDAAGKAVGRVPATPMNAPTMGPGYSSSTFGGQIPAELTSNPLQASMDQGLGALNSGKFVGQPPMGLPQGAPIQAPPTDLVAATQPPPVSGPSSFGMPQPKPPMPGLGGPMSSNPMLPPTPQDMAIVGHPIDSPMLASMPPELQPPPDLMGLPTETYPGTPGMSPSPNLTPSTNSLTEAINTQGISQLQQPQWQTYDALGNFTGGTDPYFTPTSIGGREVGIGQGLGGLPSSAPTPALSGPQVAMPPLPEAPVLGPTPNAPMSAEVMPNAGTFSGQATPTANVTTVQPKVSMVQPSQPPAAPTSNYPTPQPKPMPEPPAPKPTPSAAAETTAPKSTPTPNTSSAPAAETAPRTTGAAGLNSPASGSAPTSGTTTTQTAAKEAIANKGLGKLPVPQAKPAVPTPKYPMPQPKPEFASEVPMGGGDMPAPTPKPQAIGESTVAGVGTTPTPPASTPAAAASGSGSSSGTGLFGGMFSGNTMQYMLPAMMMMSQMGTQYPSAGGGDGEKNRFKNWNKDFYRQKEKMDWNFDPLSTSREHKYFRNKGGSGRKAEGGMVTKGPGFGSGLGSITRGTAPGGDMGGPMPNMNPMMGGGMPAMGGGMGGGPMGAPPNVQGPMSPGFLSGNAQGMAGGGPTPPNNPMAGQPYHMRQMLGAFDNEGVQDFGNWMPENPNKFLNSWAQTNGPQFAPNAATAGRRAGGGMLSEATSGGGGGLPPGVTLGGPDPVGSITGKNPGDFSGVPLMDPMKGSDPAYQYKFFMNDFMPALEGSTADESGTKDASDSMLHKGMSIFEQPKNPGSGGGNAKKMNHGGLASLRMAAGGMTPASRGAPAGEGGGGGNGGWWNNREIPQWLGPVPFASIVEQYEGTPLKDIKANGMAAGGLMGAEPPPSGGMSNRPMSPTSGGMMGGQAGGATNNPMAMGRGGMGSNRPEPAMGMGGGMSRPSMGSNRPMGGGAMGEGGFGMWGQMPRGPAPTAGNSMGWGGDWRGLYQQRPMGATPPAPTTPSNRPMMPMGRGGMGDSFGNFNGPTGANRMASGGMMMSPEKKLMKDAELALQGQHPNPNAALSQYIQVYGENSLMDLANKIAGQQPINAPRHTPNDPHFLQGPGDGMSDSIPAGNQSQDVILSDGEYVVPADVVSGLGNGSSNAGARRLDQMVSKLRQDRTGNPSQPKAIDPRRYVG